MNHLTPDLAATIKRAMLAYDFPKVLFDFDRHKEVTFSTMRELEAHVLASLLSEDLERVKRGLANIVYWGHARAGIQPARVASFCCQVSKDHLQEAKHTFRDLEGAGLLRLKKIGLPEFSNVSFLSKLRMFLDPRHFAVLDRKLMSLAKVEPATLFRKMKEQPTYIPATGQNEAGYEHWCHLCHRVGRVHFPDEQIYAADVERGVFWLIDNGQRALAAEIVAAAERDEGD